jgi:hypothetical protein
MTILWTNAALEPKRKFRYQVTFTGLEQFQFLAQTCDRPGLKISSTEHKYFDKVFHHPGRVTWDPNPLNIKVVDIQKQGSLQGIDTNESLLKLLARSGLKGLINSDGSVQTIGKGDAVFNLGDVKILVLNSAIADITAGTDRSGPPNDTTNAAGIAEEWLLKNAWLESFKPDALDYGTEDLLTVTLTVRYDWAEFKANGATGPVNPFGGAGG